MVPGDGIEPSSPVCRTGALPLDEPGLVETLGFEPRSPGSRRPRFGQLELGLDVGRVCRNRTGVSGLRARPPATERTPPVVMDGAGSENRTHSLPVIGRLLGHRAPPAWYRGWDSNPCVGRMRPVLKTIPAPPRSATLVPLGGAHWNRTSSSDSSGRRADRPGYSGLPHLATEASVAVTRSFLAPPPPRPTHRRDAQLREHAASEGVG